MKQFITKASALFALAAMTACSEDAIVEFNPNLSNSEFLQEIKITGKDLQFDDATRSSVSITESGASFAWKEDDVIGIFPNKGDQVSFAMDNGAGTQTATFSGGGWALKSSATYAAYYPHVYENRDMTKIPVSYLGQTQNGNNNTDHIGTFDFMAAAVSTPSNGSVAFDMQHLGCLIQLKIDLLEEAGIGNVSIKYGSSYNAMFTTTGYIDLTSETPQINVSGNKSSSIDVKLNNLRVEADETAVIYLMMAPANMEGKTIDVVVTEDNGFTRTFQVAGKNFVAGKAYSYSMALSKDNVAEVNVKSAGNLLNEVMNNYGSPTQITDLKITGQLNSSDIRNLRIQFDNLVTLDMSEVNIVTGGTAYYDTYTTVKDEFPAYFMREADLTKLESIILPNSVKTIPNYSFVDVFSGDKPKSTYKLTKIVLGENLTTIGIIAFACSMKSIHIPANVTTVGTATFGYCPNLESITVEEGNSKFKSIDGILYEKVGSSWSTEYMLNVCPPAKRTFEAPKDLKIVKINSRAFSDCIYLTSIELPEGVKDFDGGSVFARCISLEKVSIPSTINLYSSYCKSAFYDNSAMKELHLNTTTPPSWYFMTGTTSKEYLSTSCKLYVPYTDGWKNSSTNRSNWSRYFSIVYKYN